MLLVKKIAGAVLTFLATFLLVVGLGRASSAGAASQLPLTLGLALVCGGSGLWLLLAKPKSQASSR